MVTSSHWPGEPIMGQEDIRVFLPCLESLALRDGAHDPMTICSLHSFDKAFV